MDMSIEIFCSICLEKFQDDRKPRNLNCGHTFCTQCLHELFINKNYLVCPQCRANITFDRTKTIVNQLSVNYGLLGISNGSNCKQELLTFIQNLKELKEKFGRIDDIIDDLKANLTTLTTNNSGLNSILHVSHSLIEKLQKFLPKEKINEVKSIQIANEMFIKDNERQIEKIISDIDKLVDVKEASVSCVSLESLNSHLSKMSEIEKYHSKYPRVLEAQYAKLMEDYAFLSKFEKENMISLTNLDKNAKVESIIEGLQNDIKFSKFRIGIVGNSRTGKSSLINRLRNLADPPDDKFIFEPEKLYDQAAPVGEIETTFFPVKYTMKAKPSIELIDFPGHSKIQGDKKSSKIRKYFELFLENTKCHIYLVVYSEGLDPFDLELAKIIHEELNRKVLLVRNKSDIDFENKKARNPKKNERELLEMLKSGIKSELSDPRMISVFGPTKNGGLFEKKDLDFYCISSKQSESFKYDMKSLKQRILNEIPEDLDDGESEVLLFENITLNMNAETNSSLKVPLHDLFLANAKEEIGKIKESLEKRIVYLSLLSAATDIVPIGGTIADIAILVGELTKYRNYFGLKKEVLYKWGEKFSISDDRIANIAKIVAIDSKYIHMKNFAFTLIGAVGLGLQIAANTARAVSLGINFLTFGVGCLISAAISGPISFIMCSHVLKKALTQMETDALLIVELIYKEIVEINKSESSKSLN